MYRPDEGSTLVHVGDDGTSEATLGLARHRLIQAYAVGQHAAVHVRVSANDEDNAVLEILDAPPNADVEVYYRYADEHVSVQ